MKPFFRHSCFNAAATETDRCVPCPSAHATKIRSFCFHSASSWLCKSTMTTFHLLHRIVLLMSSVCSPQHPQKSLSFGNVQSFTSKSNFSSGSHFASNLFIASSSLVAFKLSILTPLSSLVARAYPHQQRDIGARSNPLVPTRYTSLLSLKAVRGEGVRVIHCGGRSRPDACRLLQWPSGRFIPRLWGGVSLLKGIAVVGTGPALRIYECDGLRCIVGAGQQTFIDWLLIQDHSQFMLLLQLLRRLCCFVVAYPRWLRRLCWRLLLRLEHHLHKRRC